MRIPARRFLDTVLFLSVIIVSGCTNDRVHSAATGQSLQSHDSCRFEPDHHYFVTRPDHTGPEQKYPLVIAIDPHGDGHLAMQKFRDAVKDLPIIVAGSGKLKNNYADFEISSKNLYNDLLAKYPVDPGRVLVAGFSGGARMALYYGLRNPVQGIIMFGAGPGQLKGRFPEKQIYAVSGTEDFNFSEQYRPLFSDMEGSSGYVNDFFRGTHEWPPERNIREAVVYCLRKVKGPCQVLSRSFSEDFVKEADSLQSVNDLLFAGKALEKAYFFAVGKKRQDLLSRRIDDFIKNPGWIASQQKIENFLRQEVRRKQLYVNKLQDPDMAWWNTELDGLFSQISTAEDPLEGDHYARLKGFLGIYLYSRINTLLQQVNTSHLTDRMMAIYERVEPGSEDLQKFKAALSHLRE